MATPREFRASERGLSLIEALVIVTITGLLAALLLPMASTSAGRNFTRANLALDRAETAQSEREFRILMRGAVQDERQPIEGDAQSLALFVTPETSTLCLAAGVGSVVRLDIAQTADRGSMQCTADGRRVDLLVWSGAEGHFSYSMDGQTWSAQISEARTRGAPAPTRKAPLVRFDLTAPDETRVLWVERAGWTEPTRVEAAEVTQ